MIGDESPWLVNLIITLSLLPIIIGTLGEHARTRTMLSAIVLIFLAVTVYTLTKGQIVTRPKNIEGKSIVGATYENPLAVHQSEATTDAEEEEDEG